MSNVEKFALGGGHRGTLHVGLVNNMPDAAMRATELQFARLLKEAAGTLDVRLHLFSLKDIARGDLALSRMEGFYADAATLPAAGIDALIVTGAEPRENDLRDEPYWNALTHLVDWAEIGTVSTIFSCLAAHAAILHLDGIERRKLPAKLSGIFTAEQDGPHPLQTGFAREIYVPHSRRNEVPENELSARGYHILSRLQGGGVDSFLRTGRSQFLFLQGHPEYGADTLGREYLRDVGRFVHGESAERPAIPENYFDRATENALASLESGDMAPYHAIISGARPLHSWHGHTLKLFGNWLTLVAAEKLRRLAQNRPPARARIRA